MKNILLRKKISEADLIIIMGTTLHSMPFEMLPDLVSKKVTINKETISQRLLFYF
jgi:NAD-dependent SIR2 family protein deacetylase